eukprot:Gb_10598 [translate_table: standard]
MIMVQSHRKSFVWVLVILILWSSPHWTLAQSNSSVWKTLTGSAPLVIARGGLSGLFPEQTESAYKVAMNNSLPGAVMYCDLQLTKDGQGICRPDIILDPSTNIALVYQNQNNSYLLNGHNVNGWFSIDFTAEQLFINVSATQPFLSRTPLFDYAELLPPDAIAQLKPAAIWLNVQYSKFYEQHNLSMPTYVLSLANNMTLNYISSPEVGFLRAISSAFRRSKTKLLMSFLGEEDIDPSTNVTYDSILTNLTFVKTFAAGILVPKNYIWPVDNDLYLQPHTSLVQDAHAAGLEVFAADFANDVYPLSYNYSYDPIREYLQFMDKGDFAVDGVLTDFSVTASGVIACYAHNKNSTSSSAGQPLIISRNGASGDYPGCTDIAYQAAIEDGADYIDCSVQMTKDGIAFCRESPDLMVGTTVTSDSSFYPSRATTIPEIQKRQGVYTFDLTWKEIQSLTLNIYSPYLQDYNLYRNPAYANVGEYLTLSDFLEFAKNRTEVRVLINIQYARYLLSAKNLSVIDATISALNTSGYDNMTERVQIQSDDSAVLLEFKQRTGFKLVYNIDAVNVTVPDSTIKEIKEFADTVSLSRGLIFPAYESLLLEATDIVSRMHRHNISVFVFSLRNEYPSLAFDYLCDPTMEINAFAKVAKVDGIMTEFPATAKAYLGNACLRPQNSDDYSMFLVVPGAALAALPTKNLPPVQAPGPVLPGVQEPPLPSASAPSGSASPPATVAPPPQTPFPSGQASAATYFTHSLSVSLLIALLLFIHEL